MANKKVRVAMWESLGYSFLSIMIVLSSVILINFIPNIFLKIIVLILGIMIGPVLYIRKVPFVSGEEVPIKETGEKKDKLLWAKKVNDWSMKILIPIVILALLFSFLRLEPYIFYGGILLFSWMTFAGFFSFYINQFLNINPGNLQFRQGTKGKTIWSIGMFFLVLFMLGITLFMISGLLNYYGLWNYS